MLLERLLAYVRRGEHGGWGNWRAWVIGGARNSEVLMKKNFVRHFLRKIKVLNFFEFFLKMY